MKPAVKKTIIITAFVLCALLVTILILSFISIKPLSRIGDYDANNIQVLDSYNTIQPVNDDKNKTLKEATKTVKFSVMRSLLEFSAGYNIKHVTYKNADDEVLNRSYNVDAFTNIRPLSGEYMIRLNFGEVQTNKRITDDDGKEIPFDTVVLIIPKGENEIQDIKFYPYLAFNMENELSNDEPDENGYVGSIYYRVYQFTAKMYTYKFYDKLSESGHFKTGSGGGTEL